MENFLFKKLRVTAERYQILNAEICDYVLNNLTVSKENAFATIDSNLLLQHCPSLAEFLRSLNLKLLIAGLIRSHPNQVAQTPHIDSFPQQLAINFPVQCCDQSVTNFYKPYRVDGQPPNAVIFKHPNGVSYYHYQDVEWELLGSFTLTCPMLLNIKVPHKVEHYGNITRVSLSLRFNEDPWHLTEGDEQQE